MKSEEELDALVEELRKELEEDILERYHNWEYWDKDIIENFFTAKDIENKEEQILIEDQLG